MISNKKSYAMKMLQLALALSLLHVDPDNYLQQRLRNWDSQLELRDGDGWELEMLRAVPMVEYPYANRKSMMPLIEDLIRFDRQNDHLATQYNVTAYLLNVSNESSNQTAALQEMQSLPTTTTNNPTTTVSATATSGSSALDPSTATVSSVVTAPGATNNSNLNNLPTSDIELFLNSENFQDQRSVWEQNLADLNDFNDLPIMNSHYGNLPLKDGQQDNNLFDLQLDAFLPTIGSSASTSESEGAVALNDTFPNPDEGAGIKLEQLDDEDEKALLIGVMDTRSATATILSTDEAALSEITVKKEEPEEKEEETVSGDSSVDLSPFINTVELTKEESEIVEVLWKQDVDLGYSLTSAQLADAKTSAKALQQTAANEDDIEKLKALEALKLDNSKYDPKDIDDNNNDDHLGDEWAGIPFTIDNETGEYIRLPLDEILNDVIQFAELAGEEEDHTGASTSKAAAANSKHLKSEKEEQDDEQNFSIKPSDSVNVSTKTETEFRREYKSEGDFKDDELNTDNKKKENLSGGVDDKDKDTDRETANDGDDEDSDLPQSETEVSSLPSPLFDLDDEAKEELADLSMMLHSSAPFAPHHHSHHHHHAARAAAAAGGAAAAVGVGGVQNYGGVNSAFHRQPSSGGFHHGHHQGRMPSLSRAVSMEHRFQDIAASLFNPMSVVGGVSDMSPHYPHHYATHPYSYQSGPQHAQYPPPPPPPHPHHHHAMLHPNASLSDLCSTQPHYGHNLGSAVSSSMHLTNSTHDSDVSGVGAVGGSASNIGAYKMEHDMMYYSNASSDMNHTTDGFINSILNDEDLHLMDMNVNDSFCRMVDVNNSTSNNSSVLGIPSGHANGASGSATGSSSGISMSGSNLAAAGGAAGMTTELMNTAGAQGGADRLDASSDSAVSSMGSERVPSLSDGEWGEGSDSAQDYHQGKYGGPYDYSYNNSTTNNRLNDGTRQPPVAQKKHHMFGKRFLNEQPNVNAANGANPTNPTAANGVLNGPAHAIKYEYEAYPPVAGLHENMGNSLEGGAMGGPALSKEHHAYGAPYSLDFSVRTPRTAHEIVQHNHTYTLPQGTGSLPRPQQRDKKTSTSSSSTKSSKSAHNSSGSGGEEDNYLTRDEKRARAMNIPIPVTDIINLPMDEFNERLSKYDLSENQLSLIRDIRRRGKNKVAAQNCRKRKLDQILSLEDEVKQVRRRKEDLQAQRDRLFNEKKRVSNKFGALHRHIFQYLRDPEGNPCSPSEYSLQQAADGSIYLLPRDVANKNDTTNGVLQHTSSGSSSNSNSNGSSQQTTHHQQMSSQPHGNSHVTGPHHPHAHLHLQHQQTTTAATAGAGGTLAHSHIQHHHLTQAQSHIHQAVVQNGHAHHTQSQQQQQQQQQHGGSGGGGGALHQQKD